eukprot:1973056-Pyramimonas_sp.AAC.1
MTKFEELADMPAQGNGAREPPEVERHRGADGFPPPMGRQRRSSRHALWERVAQNYKTTGHCWRQLK